MIIGIVIGLIIGAIGVFLFTSSKQRTLEAKLARTEKALGEAEALQKQQTQEIQQLQQVPLQTQEIEQSYQAKIYEIQQSYEQQLGDYQEQLGELSQAKVRLAQLEQLEAEIQAKEQSYQEQLKATEQSYQTQIEDIEQSYQAQIQALQQAKQSSEPPEGTNQERIEQIEQSYQAQLEEQKQAHQNQLREIEQAHEIQLQDLKQSHQEEIEALRTQPQIIPQSSPESVPETTPPQQNNILGDVAKVGAGIAGVAGLAGLAGLAAKEDENTSETQSEQNSEQEMNLGTQTDDSSLDLVQDNLILDESDHQTGSDDLDLGAFSENMTSEVQNEQSQTIEELPDFSDMEVTSEQQMNLGTQTDDNSLDLAQDDFILDESDHQTSLDDLDLGAFSENMTSEVQNEQSQTIEELPDLSDIDTNNLSEDFGDRSPEVLSSEHNPQETFLELSEIDTTANTSSEDSELLEILKTEETSAMDVSVSDTKKDAKDTVSDLFQEEDESESFDFLEMLPTEEETTADLLNTSTTDNQDPFADFFEPETEGATSNSDDPFADFLDSDVNDSDEDLMNLLETDNKGISEPTEPFDKTKDNDWNNLFDDDHPTSNGKLDHNSNLEEVLKASKTDSAS